MVLGKPRKAKIAKFTKHGRKWLLQIWTNNGFSTGFWFFDSWQEAVDELPHLWKALEAA